MTSSLVRPIVLTAFLVLSLGKAPAAFAQGDEYDQARTMVQRVQDDLKTIQPAGPHQGKDRERIQEALKHLSDMDRKFTKDKFSKGAVGDAISNVQSILDHNTLETRERDMLNADVHDLRELKLYKGR
jgi:hypothetical protein